MSWSTGASARPSSIEPAITMPALIVVLPVKEFRPLRVSVSLPSLVSETVPLPPGLDPAEIVGLQLVRYAPRPVPVQQVVEVEIVANGGGVQLAHQVEQHPGDQWGVTVNEQRFEWTPRQSDGSIG